MQNNFLMFIIASFFLFSCAMPVLAQAPPPEDRRKHTIAGKYVTSAQAYQMWQADPDNVTIIDCRTTDEYVFVGHPVMAYNIPLAFRTDIWNPTTGMYDLRDNPGFEKYIQDRFNKTATLLILCRSGHRSAVAANRLFRAGFKQVYNIIDGFEGEFRAVPKKGSSEKNTGGGWKNSGLPWTYELNPRLIYSPEKK